MAYLSTMGREAPGYHATCGALVLISCCFTFNIVKLDHLENRQTPVTFNQVAFPTKDYWNSSSNSNGRPLPFPSSHHVFYDSQE